MPTRSMKVIVVSAIVLIGGGCMQTMGTAATATPMAANAAVAAWPMVSQEAASAMIAKYGAPHEATASMLVWHNNGPWAKTVVYRDPVEHRFPVAHQDVLEQWIAHRATPGKFDELAMYDGSVIVERTKGVMSARCDKEAMNFLALNLAHDIITSRKNVAEARAAYAREAMAFMQGRGGPMTQALQFTVAPGNTGDPDAPVAGM